MLAGALGLPARDVAEFGPDPVRQSGPVIQKMPPVFTDGPPTTSRPLEEKRVAMFDRTSATNTRRHPDLFEIS